MREFVVDCGDIEIALWTVEETEFEKPRVDVLIRDFEENTDGKRDYLHTRAKFQLTPDHARKFAKHLTLAARAAEEKT